MTTVLSQQTIELLNNFSSINKSIVINPGNKLSTISVNKNIMCTANIEESFDKQISIYDLSQFLGCIRLFDQPNFDTSNKQYLSISNSSGTSRTRFFYSDPDVIVQPPDKELQMPSEDVKFKLSSSVLKDLTRAGQVYGVPDLCLYSDNGLLKLCVTDKKNETSNTFSIEVGESDGEFCYCFKIENLKLIDDDYNVTVSKHNVAYFEGSNKFNARYWIALEPNQ